MPPLGKRFKKGESGNRAGSSELARTRAKVKRLTAEDIALLGSEMLTRERLEKWLDALIAHSIETGSISVFTGVMDRVVGKAKETLTIAGDANNPLVSRDESREEKIARIERLRQARQVVDQ